MDSKPDMSSRTAKIMQMNESRPLELQPCRRCRAGQQAADCHYLGKVNGCKTFRCPDCRLVFVYPKLAPEKITGTYAIYHDQFGMMDLTESGEGSLFAEVLDAISKRGVQGELLDVGSSYGHFLKMARDRGFKTKGVEIAPQPCEYAKSQLGLDVECCSLDEARFESGRFSAITMLNVLEHLTDPYEILIECRRILRPDGLIAIIVPNLLLGYPVLKATRALGIETEVPTSAYHVPFHLTLFGPASLRRMLVSSGWKDIEISNAPVITNRSRSRTFAKQAVRWLGDRLADLTSESCIYGYSLLALARKQ